MRRVVAVAEGDDDADPPDELYLYWICKDLGLTPSQAMNEDYQTVSRMRQFAAVYNMIPRVRGLKGDEIHNIDPADMKLMDWLKETGVMNG